eukprot:5910722-Amphidinium_carterae.1
MTVSTCWHMSLRTSPVWKWQLELGMFMGAAGEACSTPSGGEKVLAMNAAPNSTYVGATRNYTEDSDRTQLIVGTTW